MCALKMRMSRGKRRAVAGPEQILAAARAIGVRHGWSAVTIRSVAQKLGYSSPLLYQHFRDKQDVLTQIAVQALALLEAKLTENLPAPGACAVLAMVERYWTFMLDNKQLYRLMNGMDGVPIDRVVLSQSARCFYKPIAEAVRPLTEPNKADEKDLADELWALLHGMAALYLDRAAQFDVTKASNASMRLISGARAQT